MNNFEKLKSMSVDELAELLNQYGRYERTPWYDWWDENYCSRCESVKAYVPAFEREHDFAWCELEHKCKFFQDMEDVPNSKEIIKMWLEAEVKDEEV
jgi:hypothetical protein